MTAPGLLVTAELLQESIDTLERVGCQWRFCDGPTLAPVPMVTCFACETLAKLRVAAGRKPRHDDELTCTERLQDERERYMQRCVGGAR
jgi:hypothetical protein